MLQFADAGLTTIAVPAILGGMTENAPKFEALARWQDFTRKSDAQAAALLEFTPSKFSRFKNGLQPLKMKDQFKLQEISGITPAECAEFYADAVKARLADEKPQPKKSGAAKKARRPFVVAAEPEAI